MGSGCSYISQVLSQVSPNNYKYFKLSDVLRKLLTEQGIANPTVPQLQDKGNELRSINGNGFLIEELIRKIDEKEDKYDNIIIDGIKNAGEIAILRQFPNFYLFSIHAEYDIRCKRLVKDKTFSNPDDFYKADERDKVEEYDYGQQVNKCNYLSDIIISNDNDIPHVAQKEREDFVRSIYYKYINLIEDVKNGEKSPEIFPTTDELVMTIAYSLSKMSSCLKRKVGAVIIDNHKLVNGSELGPGKLLSMPFILSSGYNEVPLGSFKCIFNPEYQKCYRDYLKESYAKKLKYCPNCGEKIIINFKCQSCGKVNDKYLNKCEYCGKEIDIKTTCAKCGNDIFEEYSPGGSKTPGKLLDMCRSLHAEENALLNIPKYNMTSEVNMILYTTTQPCNLCANKIVSAGIKEVVFAEPYLMKESAEILSAAKVNLRRFEGVKSSAYFKLYQ